MDLINFLINYLISFAVQAQAKYHVNPWLFCLLFFGSALPLYYGYYRIARSSLKIEDKKIKRKDVNHKELKIGITISVVAWWIPYVYVIIFGRLPLELWIIFAVFVGISGIFFVRTLIKKINHKQ